MADIHTLIDRADDPLRVMVFSPIKEKGLAVRVIILPGANCAASRYRWLAEPLAAEGATVFIPEPPLLEHPSPADPKVKTEAAYVTIDQMIRTLGMPWDHGTAGGEGGQTFAIGHSLGGAILMEYLDPAQAMLDPRSGVGAGYAPPIVLHGGIVIGASLQADVGVITIPWRQNDTPLTKPGGFPLLFLCGDADGISIPEQVAATVGRYEAPVAMVTQKGANHFGWAAGTGERDLRDLDGKASLSPDAQKENTLRYAASFFSAVADKKLDTLLAVFADVAGEGDAIVAR